MRGDDARDSHAGGFVGHHRRSYHLHPPGVIYLITTFFVAIGGFNSQNNLLFWAFGVAIAGLILSGIVSGTPLMNLKLARDRVEPGAVGEPLRVRYHVKNTGRLWPAFAIRVDELGERKGRSDWWSGLETIVTHVGPRETVSAGAETNALRRGVHEICTVRVSTTFPLGLVRKSLYFNLPQRVTVRPRVLELRHEIRAQLIPSFEHTARSRNRVGPGDEFYALREYEPGDPIRSVAWRASARCNMLLVRQNAAPAPPRISISLEPPPPGLSEEQFENTISLVASIVAAARSDRLTVGLSINWAQVWFEPTGGQAAIGRMLDALAGVDVSQSQMTDQGGADHDLLVTFSLSSHDGAICGADTAHWAVEPGSTMIAPPPVRRRRPIKRLGQWAWGGVRKSRQREGAR